MSHFLSTTPIVVTITWENVVRSSVVVKFFLLLSGSDRTRGKPFPTKCFSSSLDYSHVICSRSTTVLNVLHCPSTPFGMYYSEKFF